MSGSSAPARCALRLQPRARRALARRHPWVFSGAVAGVLGDPGFGETVDLLDGDEVLARAAYSPRSQIRARVWSFDPEVEVDASLLRRRLAEAVARRREPGLGEDSARRLVYSESDRLPGLIVDRYGAFVVCQLLTAGAERWRAELVSALGDLLSPRGIWERSDATARGQEGLEARTGLLAGEPPPERIEVVEDGLRLLVDVRRGHKTGAYLDQRDNRARLRRDVDGGDVLDVFSYAGGFALAALAGGAASVLQVEASAEALAAAREQAAANGLEDRLEQLQGDAFALLRELHSEGRRFDVVVLDPPKFVTSRAGLERAARGYKDVNRLGFLLLRPGGRLYTFSCSGRLEAALFQKIVADAALDAGVDARIEARLAQAADHPTLLSFPEASYLKGLVCRVG